MTLNPSARARLTAQAYQLTRVFGRGVVFSALCALSMLFTGRVPRHRIL